MVERVRVGIHNEDDVFQEIRAAVLTGETQDITRLAGRWDLGRWVAELQKRADPRGRTVSLFRQAAHVVDLLSRDLG